MSSKNIYAIGDVQGCYEPLQRLLQKINFDPTADELWFVGDLVNRGPQSLETLRFIKSLGSAARSVLGNHDIFLLTVYYGFRQLRTQDTIQDILAAPDCDELMQWLITQPLLHQQADYIMVHAGIPPQWDLVQAQEHATEFSQALQQDPRTVLKNIFGDEPLAWRDDLTGMDRLRYIVNAFTRMRFCDAQGKLDLSFKGKISDYPGHAQPWFEIADRKTKNHKIVFGHWAALNGITNTANVFALDTGCSWGEKLTAMRLSDQQLFQVLA